MSEGAPASLTIYTIGHSTRLWDDFLTLLCSHHIQVLADVRSVPRSRRNPQFSRESLDRSLLEVGLTYVHIPELGGLRTPRPDSPNRGWRNAGFRGYADHMASDEFARGLSRLVSAATDGRVAAMCAEAVPWRCHRSLLADALVAQGIRVMHIVDDGPASAHRLTPIAKVDDDQVRYPG